MYICYIDVYVIAYSIQTCIYIYIYIWIHKEASIEFFGDGINFIGAADGHTYVSLSLSLYIYIYIYMCI